MKFEEWWDDYEATCSAFLLDEASKIVAKAAWNAGIKECADVALITFRKYYGN